jgi:hypothetical protein
MSGFLSTARLDTRNPDYPDEQNSAQTAYRLYKLILKSLARLAGFKSSDSCILAPLRNLAELDRLSTEFCPNDRATLVGAGILKPEQDVGTACALMSSRSAPSLNLLASRRQELGAAPMRGVGHAVATIDCPFRSRAAIDGPSQEIRAGSWSGSGQRVQRKSRAKSSSHRNHRLLANLIPCDNTERRRDP